MGKALIIAEKPSVANDIAKALGGFQKQGDYYESDQYVLSSAVGHLLELCVPDQFEVKRGKWSFAHLPVIPPHFDLRPIDKNEGRLKLLVRLIKRPEVDALINACDAGREGELIFRYIVQFAKVKKTIKRLWLQSMTPAAIREGFAQLRDDATMRPLADAAVCRSESDWLVGINGTRAMTAFNSKTGGFHLTTVGRVQTPTLAILVEREERIKKFVPRDYWEVHGTFAAKAGEYPGRWFDEKFAKKEGDSDLKPERLWDAKQAEAIRAKCLGKPGVVTEECKPTTQLSPLLYDLTSLQREANGRFGFSAKTTLGLAQALYERHKVLTYPRTDSRALPEDYIGTVKKTLGMLEQTSYGAFADQILKSEWVRPNKRIFNNAKVSDHFAIIPTSLAPKHLNEMEAKLYDMVTKRFLAVFYPAAEFLVTTRITRVEGEPFKSEGKVMTNPGWMAVYGKEAQTDEAPTLAPVQPNETVQTANVEVVAAQTKPPARFNEATLLTAMEGAGKLVEDEELREAMSEKGLGTPATRAQIIEGLIYEKYILRQGRELQPTAKAFSLMELLHGLGIPELSSPELTGDWEFKLLRMARGQMQRAEFMKEIADMTREIVAKAKRHESDTVPGDFGTLKVPCPKCGGEIHENYKKFQCQKCEFSLWKIVAGRQFEIPEIEELLTKRQLGPLQGFRSRQGKPFAAMIRLTPELKPEFDFGQDRAEGNGGVTEADLAGQEPLGKCPKCGHRVFDTPMSYLCEKAIGTMRTCDFRSGKVILQRAIERAQMQKLLETGKTDLLDKFISRKGRPFKAFLVVKDGNVAFEFEPREPKSRNPGAKAASRAEPEPKLDFTGQEPLGKCPVCGKRVFEGGSAYVCERLQADKRPCKFKINKTILQQAIDRDQAARLLSKGKTDLFQEFISSKTGRPFPAYLVLGEAGKVSFEFPPREAEPQKPLAK
ncbi:MAG TPA: DNA topoisomerase III [Candidatus Paceibacterota bacterium]|nr:DNA topoisomerase III [Verrucomicrobiota bacterium]HSA10996.1 DNA topoisomerase III [Candidatus Paceibacterota bacterium]